MKNLFTIVFLLAIQSCSMIKITTSEKRNLEPTTLKIENNISLTTWGAIKIGKSDFFPSSFQIKTDNLVIYIDPIEVNSSEKADYILIKYAHPDHFSKKDINKLTKDNTKIICSKEVVRKLKKTGLKTILVKPNDYLSYKNLQIVTLPAYNSKHVFLWLKAHPQSKENVGFILTLNKNFKIYHAGDTDYIPEMDNITDIDLALIPIGGDNLTMNEDEAAKIINKINPNKVIPMHYEIKDIQRLNRFKELLDRTIDVKK